MEPFPREDLLLVLKKLGLSSEERAAYLILHGNYWKGKDRMLPTEVVMTTQIHPSKVYSVMKKLESLDLIDIDRMKNPLEYSVRPWSLWRLFDSRIEKDQHLHEEMEAVISQVAGARNTPKPKWDVYSGDAVVYEKMIPELIAECEKEMIIVGSNLGQTLTPDFLREFVGALDRGVAFYGLLPEDSERRFESFSEGFENAFGIEKFMTAVGKYSGKTLLMRTASLKGVTPFGIFDRAKVGFSITSSSGGRYLVTLVTDGRDVVDEFYALFRSIWDTHAEEFNLVNILGSLQETSRG